MRRAGSSVCSRRTHGVFALVAWLILVLATPRRALADGAVQADVDRLSKAVAQAKGVEKHAAMRALFNLWDHADPRQIEQALEAAASDGSAPAASRVFATILVAEARSRRGDSAGAAKRFADLGFVDRWLFVGPFDDQNRDGFASPFQPEAELAEPVVPGRSFDGKLRPVRWRNTEGSHAAVFDFGDWIRPREEICGYAVSVLETKEGHKAPRTVSLWVGAEGAFKMWFNGKPVLEDAAYRGFDFDRFATSVQLMPGKNRLTVKVCSDRTAPKIAVRVANAQGAPDLGVVFSHDPSSTEGNVYNKPDPKAPAKPVQATGSAVGPIQAFEKAVAGAKPSARDMEAYARYLAFSGGNPRGAHTARDLADKAAKADPSWERALLAADLAENRNGMRAWVEEAEKLVGAKDTRGKVALLLAKARLARSSVNWRDATPFYEEVLTIQPDNVFALLGRAELYLQAGLSRTALSVLERAVEAQPYSVSLLRVYAAQLRGLGRAAEADEIDGRWFAFRSDDTELIVRQVDRAVAANDAKKAERWMARLERVEPDESIAKLMVARAYRSLGQPRKSRQALETALETAPEDQTILRTLADLSGEDGDREGQLKYLRKILQLYPQAKDVRAYVEYLSPPKPRQDEAYAWNKERIVQADVPAKKGERTRILRRLAVTTVYPNGLASRFYQIVFQPLTDEAAAEARQYLTSYEGNRQEIELRLSRVYRKDGTVAEAIESGEGAANDPSIAMYTSVRTFGITFPRLNPGDIVELRYRVDDIAVKNDVADAFYDVEYLQDRDPIGESEYILIAPKTRELKTQVANLGGVVSEVKEEGDHKIHRFFAKDVPGLPREPLQPQAPELLGQVHVSTFKSWEDLGKWYWGLARDQLDVDEGVRKKVAELTKDKKTELEKVKAIYHYAIGLRYVALEFGLEGIKPRRCALSMARGWGDCKDKATVIVTMLRELGIPATLVLVRTGMRGDLPKDAPPSLGLFDHAIAYVPSLDLYLDGTAEGTGTTELPAMDRGSVALQINEGKAKLVRLPDPKPEASPHARKIELAVANDGSATFSIESSVQGVHAPSWRARYQSEGTRRERATQDLSAFFGNVEIGKEAGSLSIKYANDVESPIVLTAKGKAPSYARKEGDTLSMAVASSVQLLSSAGSLSTRKTDLLLGARSSATEERVLKLPAGAKIERLPEDAKVEGPFGSVVVTVKQEAGRVVVTSTLAVTKSRITPTEYAAFRAFCQKVDAALDQRLVIRL
ncbi:MAG: DUF3857 domain-containing protein [Polyangiaceae bacterium]|nr:DUF3857 domain-containing protein [Polyangiaceae bacterium]